MELHLNLKFRILLIAPWRQRRCAVLLADLGGHLGSSHPSSRCPPPGATWPVAGSRERCALHHIAKCRLQNITSPGHFSGSRTLLTEPIAHRLLLACHWRRLGALRAVSWAGPSGFWPAQGFWGWSSPLTTLPSALSRCFNWRPGRRLPGLSLLPGPPPGPSLHLKPCSREETAAPARGKSSSKRRHCREDHRGQPAPWQVGWLQGSLQSVSPKNHLESTD